MTLLSIQGMTKRFGTQDALAGIHMEIQPGEVHALVGENGAGKSTLIKIITGVYGATGGRMVWEGKEAAFASPKDSKQAGINVVHQDRQLIPSFSGYENLFLGEAYPSILRGLRVKWSEMVRRGEQLKQELGMDLDLRKTASAMTPPERTMLEMMRAMMHNCKLLILDEPTASLTDRETALLFSWIGKLRSEGRSVLYVSHRMEEIFQLSDRITVFRNGMKVGTVMTSDTSREALIRMMSDHKERQAGVHAERSAGADPASRKMLLRAEAIRTTDGIVKHADLTVHSGEIVGVFGLAGAGRTELLEAIYGTRECTQGNVTIEDRRIRLPKPALSIQNGVVLIPEDRRAHGLIGSMTIRENMTLPVLSRFANGWHIRHQAEKSEVTDRMERLQVKATGSEQPVLQLSGGNQQKVVFAKALLSAPSVLLCDEPTQAVDVMTREEIHRLLRHQAAQGCGVVFVSSDLQEVLDIADRIVVMREGRTAAELPNTGVTAEQVLGLCYESGV
ncbi:sugar ABC transporter ATP-binding protein [Paenibacillus rigui]|uniref:Ribose ABC transporter ATP-binding protein n=1 Tax=Paenibacillus rigui TaxID=554312 RepID=A0A229UTI7_9BACL|nr:sugar ABC transporter ATP-binding protein [Paenibacillus rigui]OXM86581.1 ribose ABC transporter ATP-binding protein [Paenibacillus rigui]